MSGGGSSKSTTVNYSPQEAKRRAALMDEAIRLYNQSGDLTGQYPGAAPVGFTEDSLMAQEMMRQSAIQNMGLNEQIGQAINYGLGDAMDLSKNQYFAPALDAAVRPITQSYREQVIPGITSQAISQGAYGGAREGITQALAADRYMQNVGDTSAQMSLDAYNKGQDTFARTLGFAPQAMQMSTLPAQQLSAVGAQNEQLAQQFEDFLAQGRLWDINAPWQPLQNAAQIVYGGGSSGSSTSTSGPQKNPLMGAIGGGMAGWAAGASMGASLGPWGAAAGALIGALM